MIYNREYSHPENGLHMPLSYWTKSAILSQLSPEFRTQWNVLTLQDLRDNVLMVDGVQYAGTKDGTKKGHVKLYCVNPARVRKFEDHWRRGGNE